MSSMVRTGLRIVFNYEDRHLIPEFRPAQAFDHHSQREIVIGHHGLRCVRSRFRSRRVIVPKADDAQARQLAGVFKSANLR